MGPEAAALKHKTWCNSTSLGSPSTPRALQGTGGLRAVSSGSLCWSLGRKCELGSFMLPDLDSHPERGADSPRWVYLCLYTPASVICQMFSRNSRRLNPALRNSQLSNTKGYVRHKRKKRWQYLLHSNLHCESSWKCICYKEGEGVRAEIHTISLIWSAGILGAAKQELPKLILHMHKASQTHSVHPALKPGPLRHRFISPWAAWTKDTLHVWFQTSVPFTTGGKGLVGTALNIFCQLS